MDIGLTFKSWFKYTEVLRVVENSSWDSRDTYVMITYAICAFDAQYVCVSTIAVSFNSKCTACCHDIRWRVWR